MNNATAWARIGTAAPCTANPRTTAMFTYRTRVAMHETDAEGMVYFGNYFHFAEEAECAALASVGLNIVGSPYCLPRVHVECDYRAPLHFYEEVTVETRIITVGNSSVTWEFRVLGPAGLCAVITVISSRRLKNGTAAPYTAAEKELLLTLNE